MTTLHKGDLVILKGRDEPKGLVIKIIDSTVHVLWWPTSSQPQIKTFCAADRLAVVQSAQKKLGRPKKEK